MERHLSEDASVIAWRLYQLIQAGCDPLRAVPMAQDLDLDYRLAVRLAEQGLEWEMIERICL